MTTLKNLLEKIITLIGEYEENKGERHVEIMSEYFKIFDNTEDVMIKNNASNELIKLFRTR